MSDTLKLLDRIVTRVCLAEDEDSLKKAVDDSLGKYRHVIVVYAFVGYVLS